MARKHTDQYIHHSKKILVCDFDFTKLRLMYFFFKKKDLQKESKLLPNICTIFRYKKIQFIFPFFSRARLKNVDRSSATYHSVTVDDFTVVITEFKPKVKKEKKVSNSSVKKNDKNDKNGHDGHDKNGDDNR